MNYFAIFRIITVALLLLATVDMPYGFYTFLRIVVSGVAGYGIVAFLIIQSRFYVTLFAGIVVFFNPLLPVFFEKEIWQIIDFVVSGVFVSSLYHGSDSDYIKRVTSKFVHAKLVALKKAIPFVIIAGIVFFGIYIYQLSVDNVEELQNIQIQNAIDVGNSKQQSIGVGNEAELAQLLLKIRRDDSLKCIVPYEKIGRDVKGRFQQDVEKVVLYDVYAGTLMQNDSAFHVEITPWRSHSKIHVHHNGKSIAEPCSLYSRVLKTLEVNDSTFVALIATHNKSSTYHGCGLIVSAAYYTFHENLWSLTVDDTVGIFGSFGDVDEADVDTFMCGNSNVGFQFESGFTAQGVLQISTTFLAFVDNELKEVWSDVVTEDNSGFCTPGRGNCYEFTKIVNFVYSPNVAWFDFELVTTGTDYSESNPPKVVNVNKTERFYFNGEKYTRL